MRLRAAISEREANSLGSLEVADPSRRRLLSSARLAEATHTPIRPTSTRYISKMSDLSLRLSVAEKRMQRERYVSRATALSPHSALRRRI